MLQLKMKILNGYMDVCMYNKIMYMPNWPLIIITNKINKHINYFTIINFYLLLSFYFLGRCILFYLILI